MTIATVLPPAVCLESAGAPTRDGQLLAAARSRHGRIQPCAGKDWSECFTWIGPTRVLWYNDRSGSTHVVMDGGEV